MLSGFITLSGCAGTAVLSELFNDQLKVKMKLTYETEPDHVRPWQPLYYDNLLFDDAILPDIDLSADDDYNGFLTSDLASRISQEDIEKFMDIGEIRLAKGPVDADFAEIVQTDQLDEFWEYFVRDRRVFCTRFYNTDENPKESDKDTCDKQGGRKDMHRALEGRGVDIPNYDVSVGTYRILGSYIRRLSFDQAFTVNRTCREAQLDDDEELECERYDADGDGEDETITYISTGAVQTRISDFDTFEIDAEDYLTYAQFIADQAADASVTTPQLVPLDYRSKHQRERDLRVMNRNDRAILEIRYFIRNLLMLHRLNGPIENNQGKVIFGPLYYVGLSDWRYDHPVNSFQNGGNLISRGRVYYPKSTGTVTVVDNTNALTIDPVTNPNGVAPGMWLTLEYAEVDEERLRFDRNDLPLAAAYTEGSETITFNNIMPGKYKLYRTCDLVGAAPRHQNFTVSSFTEVARISFRDVAGLSQTALEKVNNEGIVFDLKILGRTVTGIWVDGNVNSVDGFAVLAENLRSKLRTLDFPAEFEVVTGQEDVDIEIRPEFDNYLIQADFQDIGQFDHEMFEILNLAEVGDYVRNQAPQTFWDKTFDSEGYVTSEDRDIFAFLSNRYHAPDSTNPSATNFTYTSSIHNGPDGFPEEIRKCADSFVVLEGENTDLGTIGVGDCDCDGTAYPDID